MAHGRSIDSQHVFFTEGGQADVFQSNDVTSLVRLVVADAQEANVSAWALLTPDEAVALGARLIAEASHAREARYHGE